MHPWTYVYAKMLLQDITLTKNNGSLDNCLNTCAWWCNGAGTTFPLWPQLFAVSSFHITAWQNCIFLAMGAPDDRGLVLRRLQLSNRCTYKSLYVLDALKVRYVLPVSFQLFALCEAECFCSRIIRASSALILERSELHHQLVGVAPRRSKT